MLRWLGILLVAALGVIVVVALFARMADGPVGLFPGGELRAGELVTDPQVNWSFAEPIMEIELQLVDPPRSRTTWVIVDGGELYVPCGFLNVPLWKQWPHQALRDGRAILRIAGKRYQRQAVRVEDPELHAELSRLSARKYGLGEGGSPDRENVWFFRMDPR